MQKRMGHGRCKITNHLIGVEKQLALGMRRREGDGRMRPIDIWCMSTPTSLQKILKISHTFSMNLLCAAFHRQSHVYPCLSRSEKRGFQRSEWSCSAGKPGRSCQSGLGAWTTSTSFPRPGLPLLPEHRGRGCPRTCPSAGS